MNMMRTGLLLAAMTAIFLVVGALLGGRGGMIIALGIAVATNAFAFWNSDRIALASNDAQEVDAQSAPDLFALVGELAQRAGLPMPRVYVIHSDQPNAFATGRDPAHAAVAVNTGLMQMLTREELAGVIAHELAHVRNRDTLTMTITATLAGAISSIAQWGMFFGGNRQGGPGIVGSIALAILAPLAAMIVQMAVSRGREYEADMAGAAICGNPLWLANALAKISQGAAAIPNEAAERNPAMAHMFIVNPLSGQGMDNLFSTHPDVENRIAALEQFASEMGIAADGAGSRWSPFSQRDAFSSYPTNGPWGSRDAGFLGGEGIAPGSRWRRGPQDDSDKEGKSRGPWG